MQLPRLWRTTTFDELGFGRFNPRKRLAEYLRGSPLDQPFPTELRQREQVDRLRIDIGVPAAAELTQPVEQHVLETQHEQGATTR